MENKIIEKIQKLLALSESYNSHEAEISMLKAQEMLVKHKLSLKEVKDYKQVNSKIETKNSKISFTSAKWKGRLAGIIADNFGCFCYFKTRRVNTIIFLGREEDVAVCNLMLIYALDSIESTTKMLKYQKIKDNLPTKGIANDYSVGFVEGLKQKFEEQKKNNQEWGLVLVKDKDVTEAFNNIKFNRKVNVSSKFKGNKEILEKGIKDGNSFNISDKIEEGVSTERLTLN